MPTIHFDGQSASSLLKTNFILSSMYFFASLCSVDLQSHTLMPFSRHDHSSAHCLLAPTDLLFHFNPTSESCPCTPHILTMFPFAFYKIPILLSFRLHFHTEFMALQSLCKQALSPLKEISFHIVTRYIP